MDSNFSTMEKNWVTIDGKLVNIGRAVKIEKWGSFHIYITFSHKTNIEFLFATTEERDKVFGELHGFLSQGWTFTNSK